MSGPEGQLDGRVGVVVIGRNEGERLDESLKAAIEAAAPVGARVVYADSASTDESAARAGELGLDVVALPATPAPNAARARNAGFALLCARVPTLEFVQFVDGDTTIDAGWLGRAVAHLEQHATTAAVCGHLREHGAGENLWSTLLDHEWQGPVGAIEASGGNVMLRRGPLEAAGGFDESLPQGEEPDLCRRMRSGGSWSVERLDAPMGVHCARDKGFVLWWRRAVRGGRALVGAWRASRGSRRRAGRHGLARALGWAVILPVAIIVASVAVSGWCAAGSIAYPAQMARIAIRRSRLGSPLASSLAYGMFVVLEKFPQAIGVVAASLLGR